MTRLTINKNGQATITIPKEVIRATKWKNGQKLYVGKKEESKIIFIEEIGDNKK